MVGEDKLMLIVSDTYCGIRLANYSISWTKLKDYYSTTSWLCSNLTSEYDKVQ